MLLRRTKIQLVVFVLVSVVALVYALFRFTDVGRVFGQEPYTVTMGLSDSGGIFSNAEVTYRGFNVGRVGELRLTEKGLEVDLTIAHDAPPIPADIDALVMNRSAIGEQFVDLRPRSAGAPYLEPGATIPVERTTLPPGTDEVIESAYQFANSVPTDSLRTVVNESFDAFSGTGDDLRLLMDATRDFTKAARDGLPATVELLDSGTRVLRTQNEEASSLRSFSRDLKLLSETLEGSDADIRRLIDATPRSARQISEVVNEVGPGLSSLVAHLITLGDIALPRLEGLEQSLMTYPALSAGALAVPDDGQVRLGLALNLFDPPSCAKGYEGTERRPGDDVEDRPHNTEAYCAEPPGSPVNVRGSHNAPFNGVPQAPTAQQVEQNQDRDAEALAEQRDAQSSAGGSGLQLTSIGKLLGLDR